MIDGGMLCSLILGGLGLTCDGRRNSAEIEDGVYTYLIILTGDNEQKRIIGVLLLSGSKM